jgi:hypothetical protein
MLKLLLCIFCATITATVLLELRQQRLNLTFQNDELHNRIQATQAQLWNQQLSIAVCTAPNALAAQMKGQAVKLTNPTSTVGKRAWVDDPDADAE